jgi:prolyl-tRNA editing enzyme YbaK/EbsC (Cys-tRNA(Pro) deacylase)
LTAAASGKLSGPDRLRQALAASGIAAEVRELPTSTRTAQAAADTVGCTVAEIAKSLVFRGSASGRAVLAIMSGSNRVDSAKLSALAGETLAKADADFVRSATGYAIGGVPPFGFPRPLLTFLDEDLFQYPKVWAAAGSPFAVFEVTPADLERASAAQRGDLKE